MNDCIFCSIVAGQSPANTIWEDEHHLAFLSIFPNTAGFSVVIPKAHYPSYVFSAPESVMVSLLLASKKVAELLDERLGDVGRTALIFEGFGVDHLHAKLIPLHGTKMDTWRPIKSTVDTYLDQYQGFVSSHDGRRADDAELARLAKMIRVPRRNGSDA